MRDPAPPFPVSGEAEWPQDEMDLVVTLNWEAPYAVALELKRSRPDVNVEGVSLRQIYDWTLSLAGFDDDPALCNDEILFAIYQEWYEETLHDRKST